MFKQLSGWTQRSGGLSYAPGILLLWGLLALLPHPVLAFDNAESRATLQGLGGIEVGVGEILPEVARSGVTVETIRQEAIRRLQRAGITTVNRQELLQRSDAAFLAVTVGAIRHPAGKLYAYSIDVSVYQTATLLRDTAIVLSLPTWSIASFGIVGSTKLPSLLASIGKRVDHFIQAHEAVNPRIASPAPSSKVKVTGTRLRTSGQAKTPTTQSDTR